MNALLDAGARREGAIPDDVAAADLATPVVVAAVRARGLVR